jgi:hypothetical protein
MAGETYIDPMEGWIEVEVTKVRKARTGTQLEQLQDVVKTGHSLQVTAKPHGADESIMEWATVEAAEKVAETWRQKVRKAKLQGLAVKTIGKPGSKPGEAISPFRVFVCKPKPAPATEPAK